MRRRRELQIDFINRNAAEFRGPGIREVYAQQFGRPPVFNTRTRSWSAPPHKVIDLAAYCESRGWDVTYSHPPRPEALPHQVEQPDPGRGLW